MKINRERVENCKKALDQLSNLLEEVLDGEKTLRQVADTLGITQGEVGKNLDTNFSYYLKKNHILSDEDLFDVFEGIETTCENLVKDVLEVDSKDKFLLLDPECQELFEEEIKTVLTSKEYDVVSRYYGLDGEGTSTLAKIGKELGVSTAYINQLRRKALRKLRKDACLTKLVPQFKKYFIKLEDTEAGEKIDNVISNLKSAEIEKLAAVQQGEHFIEGGVSITALNLPIALSLTLRENQINTVAELTSKTKNDILAIRGIGTKGLEDIKAALFKFGLRLKPVV